MISHSLEANGPVGAATPPSSAEEPHAASPETATTAERTTVVNLPSLGFLPPPVLPTIAGGQPMRSVVGRAPSTPVKASGTGY